ncbi:hypothetical protein HanHA300_Chr14g0517691 [Helianthus annuus]|nr:hypothetical protein HanHA300_Chr14g0517691 [Helianthus annuus]
MGGAIVVGTWTVEFHVKHLHYENLILMLDFYINASATQSIMFGDRSASSRKSEEVITDEPHAGVLKTPFVLMNDIYYLHLCSI